ncbi:MAG TPA: ferrous iron transport protein B [Bacteroidales bacterium]|nr:ferrous iron transport protein B [Bacteroidales bacterium]
MKLADLHTGEYGIITKVQGIGAFRKRIMEMGFIKGKKIQVVKNAPLKDPIEYNILGYEVSLRRSEAALIEVITEEEARQYDPNKYNNSYNGVFTEEKLRRTAVEHGRVIEVAMIGNPNSGKTSLFNWASNSREHVGNYAGVTVDSKTAEFRHKGYTIKITDLPGTYSLTAYSPEEIYVRKYIASNHPDIIINVVDASNLERNLYLTTQLIDMDVKIVMALNMYDELQQKGHKFNYEMLGKMLGIPIIPTIGSKGKGIPELMDKIVYMFNDKEKIRRHIHINYGKDVEQSILVLRSLIRSEVNQGIMVNFSSRFLAVKLLENDTEVHKIISVFKNYEEIKKTARQEIKKLEIALRADSETVITDAKYGFITGALKETYSGQYSRQKLKSVLIDNVLTHKYWGFPVFIFFLWFIFETTFKLGEYPMNWIDQGVISLSSVLGNVLPNGSLKDLLLQGIIGGVGGVLVFLPNILILFFFISLMEDTGYMARAAFIMDKIMHKIGLHGKSFIPLIMGFGCNVPAIMATRTIESRSSRIITMLINPFFSCSARLPVYVLIIAAFAPKHPGFVLFAIYIFGIIMAALMAIIFRKLIFKKVEVPFVMELPPYRIPNPRSTIKHMWHKAEQYLRKMGGIILTASVIIWALGYFPREVKYSRNYDSKIAAIQKEYTQKQAENTIPSKLQKLEEEKDAAVNRLNIEKQSDHQQQSYAGKIGKWIEPAIEPLGFDWRMGVALLSGIAAKEVIISTMGILYDVDTSEGDEQKLINRLAESTYSEGKLAGKNIFNPAAALSFLVFILIYFPCVAVVAAMAKESGSWKLTSFAVVYTTALAWIVSFLVFNGIQLIS